MKRTLKREFKELEIVRREAESVRDWPFKVQLMQL